MNEIDQDYEIIPNHICPSKFYSIEFSGWSTLPIFVTDLMLTDVSVLAAKSVQNFIEMYKDTHAFTLPEINLKPNGVVEVKIATLEKVKE